MLPFFDDLHRAVDRDGAYALLDMPADHWLEIGAVGTIDDALAHVAALEQAGVGTINVFPAPDLERAWELLPLVASIAAR